MKIIIVNQKKIWGKSKRKSGCLFKEKLCGIIILICITAGILGFSAYYMNERSKTSYLLNIDHENVIHYISEKYLSIALDTSIIRKKWKNFDMDSPVLLELASALSPAYFRLGGTAADCLIFDSGTSMMNYVSNDSNMPVDGGLCVYKEVSCESYHQNFTMRASDWLKVNNFLKSAGLDLLFDLNVLLRKGGNWDPSNAIELIQFSKRNNLNLSWQLGNEPNSFQHVFNRNMSGAQLGRDFVQLRSILNEIYNNKAGLVVGPDITQPRLLSINPIAFLEDFLEEINTSGERVIDAVTWHQYYLSGKEAELKDFFDLANYNILAEEIKLVKNIVLENSSQKLPIWITETSDAYGGGAPNFTDRFVGGFLWLDKLGLAAYHGIQIVARQTIFGGSYALIDKLLKPLPDYWLSLLHKKLVSNKVLKAQIGIHETNDRNSANENVKKLRFYCHCAPSKLSAPNESAVTIFGMNLGLETAKIVVKGLENAIYRDTYILQGEYGLQSRHTLLNGKRLEMIHETQLPELRPIREDKSAPIILSSHSMGFWVYGGIRWSTACA